MGRIILSNHNSHLEGNIFFLNNHTGVREAHVRIMEGTDEETKAVDREYRKNLYEY